MKKKEFFDVKYLFKMLDKNGLKPEIFIVCSRGRGLGKTTSIGKELLKHFFDTGEKFVLICRYKGDVGNYAEGVLKYCAHMVGGWTVSEKAPKQAKYSKIILSRPLPKEDPDDENEKEQKEEVNVGYVTSLKAAYQMKDFSSIFVDAWCSWQDEFILHEEKDYYKDEIKRLKNLHTSLARGDGQAVRYFPHILSANCIDVLNPYFIALGFVGKIQSNTKKYHGDGVVYMRYESEVIAKKHAASGFNRAFKHSDNENDFDDNSWLVDESTLTGKPEGSWGQPWYMCNLHIGDTWLRVANYSKVGVCMIDKGIDPGNRTFSMGEPELGEIAWDIGSHNMRKSLSNTFKQGRLRFRTEQAKREFMENL